MKSRYRISRQIGVFQAVLLLFWAILPNILCGQVQGWADAKGLNRQLSRMVLPGNQDLELIVELSDSALLERMEENRSLSAGGAAKTGKRRLDFNNSFASYHRAHIRRAQEPLQRKMLELPGTQVIRATSTLMNAIIIRTPISNYQAVRNLPGVKKVYFSRPRRAMLDSAGAMQNAQNLWTAAGGQMNAGKGIKIGIIDSGIDIKNKMFAGTGLTLPEGFPKYNNSNQAYTNNKVIVARSYITDTAVDDYGHGSFVAACAAGEPVDAPLASISGMAPGAYLGSYDVLDWRGSTTTAAIMSAIDDAAADGMDVVNLSIGSIDFLPPEENAEYQTIQRAVQSGLIMVVAAGNSGSGPYTISSPATMSEVITVGSATSMREFLPVIHTSIPDLSTIGYVSSLQGALITENIPSTKIVDVALLDQSGLGCSRLPAQSLAGSIALIERGTCPPATKVMNAQLAGAVGIIVYNNSPVGMTQMPGLENRSILYRWAVMISMTDGQALKRYIAANPSTASVSLDKFSDLQSVPIAARIVSGFSSGGPSTDFGIKPDLVAIGENVYSATTSEPYFETMYDKSGFTSSLGTSFATPMVTGAAAALLAQFPDLTPVEIKSLLTSTASRNITVDGSAAAGVLRGGSGLLNMGNAAAAGAVVTPASLSFGVHSYNGSYSGSKTITIKNISASADEFTFDFEPLVAGPEITFSKSSTGPMEPQSSTDIEVQVTAGAPLAGGFQGFIAVKSASNAFVYRIPYWAGLYVAGSQRTIQVARGASGDGSYGNLADALANAQPGDIIEIADDGTYDTGEEGIMITTNNQGLPLHGLTIRAAAGRKPLIQVSSGTVGFTIVGRENVRLQRLTIEGGAAGVRLFQPSKNVPSSLTIEDCTVADASDIGVLADGGGSLEIIRSVIEDSSGTGLVSGMSDSGTQLTIIGSTIRRNQSDGVDVLASNVNISNSTISGNRGAGILLYNATGTLSGNTIAGNRSYMQDYVGNGIEILEGKLTIRGNLIDSNDARGITRQWFSSGSQAKVFGNTIQGNQSYGLYSAGLLSLLPDLLIADGNLIKGNGGGIYLSNASNTLIVNNLIFKSTGSTGNGITLGNVGSNVRIINNTIYKNAQYGISLSSGTISVANSIIVGNTAGELQGIAEGFVQSSITSGSPGFVNADSDDFSLAPDSQAIDAGTNDVPNLPFVDYLGRLRVASVADLPGSGKVDIGAYEANSAYPLVYPVVVNGNAPTLGGSFTTGVVYSNPDSAPMHLHFNAFDADGQKLAGSTSAEDTLDAEAQKAILGFQLFNYDINAPFIGSVLGYSDTPPAGFFLFLDSDFRQFSTGANALSRLGKDLVFMRHQSDAERETRYLIFNPGVNAAEITSTLRLPDGSTSGTPKTAALPAKGSALVQFDPGVTEGYVRIASDRPLAGVELVGYQSVQAALGGASPDTHSRLYFPHFAVGDHYSTQVGIVNTGASAAVIRLNAYDDQANLLGTVESIELKPGGQLMKTLTELFGIPVDGPIRTGYLVAESDQPGVMGYTDYSYSHQGRICDAAIPADSVPSRHLLFSHIAHGVNAGNGMPYQTGIALLNPFGTAVDYTMRVYDGAGRLVAESDMTIGPRQKVAKILAFPDPGPGFFSPDFVLGNGHVEVTSEYGLIGLELFYTTDLSQMASVPAQIRD